MTRRQADTLENTITFLQKRDGIDKVLKLLRYTVKIVCVSTLKDSDSDLAHQLRSFEGSLGTTRKALKLGKFLKDVDALRKTEITKNSCWPLELVANGGEAVYLFLEQITWLIKAGLVAKRFSPRVSRLSAWAELIGYTGSIALSAVQLLASYHAETALLVRLRRISLQDDEKAAKIFRDDLAKLRFHRTLRQLAILQDFADAMIAVNDIRDGRGRLSSPLLMSLLGLLSAVISAHKNWPRQ